MTITYTACLQNCEAAAHYHCWLYIVGDSNLILMFSIDYFGVSNAIDEIYVVHGVMDHITP